jgi:hypothetical protein
MNLDDLIARLGTLSSADRDWLLEALSPTAREQLLRLTRGELARADGCESSSTLPQPEAAVPLDASDMALEPRSPAALVAHLQAASVSVLAEILGTEPIWLTAALLRIREWPWRTQLLQRLPHVAMCLCPPLDAPKVALSEHFTRALLERIAARVDGTPEPVINRFEVLVQKLAARRRRASWHL